MVCIRCVDELLQDHENVIGVYISIDAKTLADGLEDVLLQAWLKILHGRGQYYDGAANMSGSKTITLFAKRTMGSVHPLL